MQLTRIRYRRFRRLQTALFTIFASIVEAAFFQPTGRQLQSQRSLAVDTLVRRGGRRCGCRHCTVAVVVVIIGDGSNDCRSRRRLDDVADGDRIESGSSVAEFAIGIKLHHWHHDAHRIDLDCVFSAKAIANRTSRKVCTIDDNRMFTVGWLDYDWRAWVDVSRSWLMCAASCRTMTTFWRIPHWHWGK